MKKEKVLFKKYIPSKYENVGGITTLVQGTGKLENEYTHPGLFHAWGLDNEDVSDGSYSVGIIELEDGTVELVPAVRIKFI